MLIYCNIEEFKLFSFHKTLVESKSLPTVLQTAKNNIDLESIQYGDYGKAFFQELVVILELDLDTIMVAISTTASLKDPDMLNSKNTTMAAVVSGDY